MRHRISSYSRLQRRIAKTPITPGIYRWLDKEGKTIYIGKAKNLRRRLTSYFQKNKANQGPWKRALMTNSADFDITVTQSDLEALILETNLIKEYRPKYNVLMKDDKNYLFIRISVEDPYPRVETVRKLEKDGAKYFGPYLSSAEVRKTLDMLQETLQYRACKQSLDRLNRHPGTSLASDVPCLEYQIGRCNGLCNGAVDSKTYLQRIEALMNFLKGNRGPVREIVKERMQRAALERKFELAAKLRNYLLTFAQKPDQQLVTDATGEASDILGVTVLSNRAHVVILHRRSGRMIGESHFALSGQAESIASVLEQFLPQFYDESREIPPIVMLPTAIENSDALRDLLSQRRDGTVEFLIPQRGRKTRLLQLAEKNALEKARQAEATWEAETRNTIGALTEIQHILKLPSPPRRIEGYDISHLSGTETVGSMVVFHDGKAANDQYRSFTIRTMKEGEVDDYRALREILTRRLRHISGGLRRELAIRKTKGFTIRKARKADIQGIAALIKTHPVMNATDLNDGTFFVVEKKKMIIGCCRVYEHPTKLKELRSLCIADTERGNRLGQSLVRMLLAKQKHDKIYIIIDPALEEYYAETSFRHVLRVPLALTQKIERILAKNPQLQRLETMVYDPKEHKPDRSLESTPDLLVIDGGKGQLSVTTDMLRQAGLTIPVIALAKREEELFVPDSRKPVPIPKDSPALFLLMRLRDEAHRFANRHREKRTHRHLHL